jgi:hypothetical protein
MQDFIRGVGTGVPCGLTFAYAYVYVPFSGARNVFVTPVRVHHGVDAVGEERPVVRPSWPGCREIESKDKVLGRITAGVAITTPAMQRRSAGRASLAAIGVVLALLTLGLTASSASATTGHVFLDNFGLPGSNASGGFAAGGPANLAIRQSNGDVYVSDPAHLDPNDNATPMPRIERFDASGVFQSDFLIDATTYSAPAAIAIDPAGSVYVGAVDTVAATGAVLKYSLVGVPGTPLDATGSGTTFANPVALAVDPSDGTVFVSAIDTTTSAPLIDTFDNTGAFVAKFDGSDGAPGGAALAGIGALAVDGSDRLYVSDGQKVYRYSAAGAYQATVDDGSHGGNPGAITADTTTGEIYVVDGGALTSMFSAGGAWLNTFRTLQLVFGVAVNEVTGIVYTADYLDMNVKRWTPGATVITGSASAATAISASLNGTLNTEGIAGTTYNFQYGDDQSYGRSTPIVGAGSGNADVAVTGSAVGLLRSTTYHFRLVATNSGGVIYGEDHTFTTNSGAVATTGVPTGVTTTAATFSGTYDTHGLGGSYQFVISSSTSPFVGQTAPQAVSGAGTASGSLDHLPAGETYKVRLQVTSDGVTSAGDAATFSTPPLPTAPPAPPASDTGSPYGCNAPVLAAYNPHPKPGDTINIAGTDLGVGGTANLGTTSLSAADWSASGFSVTLPDDATGTLGLTVNCGTVSNTIAIAVYQAPSNSFTATAKTKSSTATVSVKVPGPGSISVRSGNIKTATKRASKASTNSVKVTLTSAAAKALKKHHKLAVTLTVRFTPTGGSTATKTVKVAFKR